MKKLARKEIYIGLSVIVAILILIFGIEYLKGINLFRPANFYIANYDNVNGLDISAPVKVNGYKVGQVREINFNYEKPGKTEVVLALNKNLHLPVDSKAVISSSLMGEAFIEINVGNSTELIPVGGEVPTSEVPGLLDGLSDTLMPKITETLGNVDNLLIDLDKVAADPAIKSTLGRLDGISNNILSASQGLNTLISSDIRQIMQGANGVVSNANGVVYGVGGIIHRVDTVASNLSTLTAELNRLPLQQTMESVSQTVANLESFSAQLKNQNSTLGMLMNDPELYNRINNVAASVDSLINDIKKNPKRYINIKLL